MLSVFIMIYADLRGAKMGYKVVKASAGTGKTYRLSIEYMNMLLQGKAPEEIVVITFTRKATAEIRAKIFSNIEKLLERGTAESDMIVESLVKIGNMSEKEEIFKIISRRRAEMLRRKDKIKITTIDSFINSIFSKIAAPASGLYSYEIIDDTLNREYLMNTLEKIVENRAYFSQFREFLEKYTERDIEKYLEWIGKILDFRWFFSIIENEPELKAVSESEISAEFEKFKERFMSFEEVSERESSKIFMAGQSEIFGKKLEEMSSDDLKKFITVDRFWKKEVFKKNPESGGLAEAMYGELKKKLADYIFNKEVYPLYNELKSIEKVVSEVYDNIKFKERKFTHSDIAYYTFDYFSRGEGEGKITAADLHFYEAIDSSVRAILIDEFQDTSVIQWKIVYPIVKNSETAVCVGDEKQSIYSFRGGEKGLFENLDSMMGAAVETLDTSYRSSSNVIKFVNLFFGSFNPEWKYSSVNYLPSKEGGEVEIVVTDNKNSEKTWQQEVLKIVKKCGDYSKTAILARKNIELEQAAELLFEAGIPFIKEGGKSIIEHRAVKPVYTLLKYLARRDFINLLEFLRSDLFSVSMKELEFMASRQQEIYEFIFLERDNPELYKNQIIAELLTKIKKAASTGYIELSNKIFSEFAVLNIYGESKDRENLLKFISIMKQFSSLEGFVEYSEQNSHTEMYSQEGGAGAEGVTLMTIHKSKGLEFENCICFIKGGGRKGGSSSLIESYIKYDKIYGKIEKVMFTSKNSDFAAEYIDEELCRIREKQESDEWINNLYVALTRAKNNLYLVVEFQKAIENIKLDSDGSDYRYLCGAIEAAAGADFADVAQNGFSLGKIEESQKEEERGENSKLSGDYENRFSKELLEKLLILKKGEAKNFAEPSYKEQEFQKIGLASHYYLSFIKSASISEKESSRSMTYRKYGNMLGSEKLEEIIGKLDKFIEKNPAYFDSSKKVITELSIFDEIERREYRIDRIIIDDEAKKALIVDFKTGKSRDKRQLDKYIELVSKKLEGYEIEALFENI